MVGISPGMRPYGYVGSKIDARKNLLEVKKNARVGKSKLKWKRREILGKASITK